MCCTIQWQTLVGIGHEPAPMKIDAGSLDQLAVDMLRRMGSDCVDGCWLHPDDARELHRDPWLSLSEIRNRCKVNIFEDRLRQMQERLAADYAAARART